MSRSSGSTCGARGKAAALLTLLGLTLAALSAQAGLVSAAFGATSAPSAGSQTSVSGPTVASSVQLSMGFSPSTLTPVSQGVPVYTVGETIWALSGYGYPVPVSVTSVRPSGVLVSYIVSSDLLEPGVVSPVYTFGPGDLDGLWNVTLVTFDGSLSVPVRFVNLADHQASLGALSYALDGGNLSISSQAVLGDSYDQQVCAAGLDTLSGVGVSFPAGMQPSGNVTLAPSINSTLVRAEGNITRPFSFWFELYHPYSLDVTSANSLVASNLLAASSQPVAFTSPGASNSTLRWSAPMRDGRYDLRAYFRDSSGLQLVESSLLVVNGTTWVSLTNQCAPEQVTSKAVSYSESLARGPETWPKTIYFMYRSYGVEAVASYPVDASLASIKFLATPWNQTLPDLKVNVSPSEGVVQTSQAGSTLYVLASSYPVSIQYSVDISGGVGFEQGSSVTVPISYSTKTLALNLAKLTVYVVSDQSSPTNLEVTGPRGLNIAGGLTGTNQTMSFVLPPGTYSVTATQAGNTQAAQVALTDGLVSVVTLNFNTLVSFEIILVVTAVIAAVANVMVFLLRGRGIAPRLAGRKSPKQ